MTNLERDPQEVLCTEAIGAGAALLTPRDVPLGGPRAMTVRRTLPQRHRSLIGAWCFLDHYGPDPVAETGGMSVARHPHTGLATVSWLFTGGISHLDSAGYRAEVRPGEVNLMIAGRGISHQEFSTPDTTTLHGVQLWYALPDDTRQMAPTFEHYTPEPVKRDGAELRVFIGSLAGSSSPVNTYTPPLVGAEILMEPGAELELDLDPSFEHGILVDTGDLSLNSAPVPEDHLAYLPTEQDSMVLTAGEKPVRAMLLGGEPLGEQIVMWWNFVGRTHEEVAAYREQWQAEIDAEPAPAPESGTYSDGTPYPRFGPFPDGQPAPLRHRSCPPSPCVPAAEPARTHPGDSRGTCIRCHRPPQHRRAPLRTARR